MVYVHMIMISLSNTKLTAIWKWLRVINARYVDHKDLDARPIWVDCITFDKIPYDNSMFDMQTPHPKHQRLEGKIRIEGLVSTWIAVSKSVRPASKGLSACNHVKWRRHAKGTLSAWLTRCAGILTGHRGIPGTKGQWCGASKFPFFIRLNK